ncbi:anti-sigma factor family protein [Kribbella sp. CA-247076]|uniref:anti-sigma factor family protein n=1 Tax=Kribbella sp. CA-247076 TaxID=3239941 RepID=UPI003D89EFA2
MSDIDCRTFVEQVSSYLDGDLSSATEEDFVDHLAQCDGCERYLEQMRLTTASLADLPADAMPADARSALLEAFRSRRS